MPTTRKVIGRRPAVYGDRPGVAERAEVGVPVEADLRQGGHHAADLQQLDGRTPLVADAELHEVADEEGQADAERHPPHHPEAVGLEERFAQEVGAVLDRAHGRVQRGLDQPLHAGGELGDVRRQRHGAQGGDPQVGVVAMAELWASTTTEAPAISSGQEKRDVRAQRPAVVAQAQRHGAAGHGHGGQRPGARPRPRARRPNAGARGGEDDRDHESHHGSIACISAGARSASGGSRSRPGPRTPWPAASAATTSPGAMKSVRP